METPQDHDRIGGFTDDELDERKAQAAFRRA